MTHLEKHESMINNQKEKKKKEAEPQMIQVLEVSHKDFKITIINVLKEREKQIKR